jgi:predicted nucleic acid-binding protein
MPTVLDASALVGLLVSNRGHQPVAAALAVGDAMAPGVLDAEVLHTLARLERIGYISPALANAAVDSLETAPIERFNHPILIRPSWALRANLTGYDAMYAALARAMDCALITADARFARAVTGEIAVTVVPG